MIDDGRALTFAAMAAILGFQVVKRGAGVGEEDGPDPALIDLATRVGKPIASKGLVYHPDGLVTRA